MSIFADSSCWPAAFLFVQDIEIWSDEDSVNFALKFSISLKVLGTEAISCIKGSKSRLFLFWYMLLTLFSKKVEFWYIGLVILMSISSKSTPSSNSSTRATNKASFLFASTSEQSSLLLDPSEAPVLYLSLVTKFSLVLTGVKYSQFWYIQTLSFGFPSISKSTLCSSSITNW